VLPVTLITMRLRPTLFPTPFASVSDIPRHASPGNSLLGSMQFTSCNGFPAQFSHASRLARSLQRSLGHVVRFPRRHAPYHKGTRGPVS